jgi:hypothetical protein
MLRQVGPNRRHVKVAWLLLMLLSSSCAAAQQFSRRTGQIACASFDRCMAYDDAGKHEATCFQPADEAPQVFAGNSRWPLSTAVCPFAGVAIPFAG